MPRKPSAYLDFTRKNARRAYILEKRLNPMSSLQCFIGIGAPRCGTTWLSRRLSEHPDIAMSPIKELHYWNSQVGLTRPEEQNFDGRTDKWGKLRQEMKTRSDYFYYMEQVRKDLGGIPCEITPGYMMCPTATFEAIKAVAPDTKFFFVVREPAQRVISQCRMKFRRTKNVDWGAWDNLDHVARTDYFQTIAKLEDAGVDHTVLIYELLTAGGEASADEFKRLTDFLGISPIADVNLERGMDRTEPHEPPKELPAIMWRRFAPQRDAVYRVRPDAEPVWNRLQPR